MSIIGPPTHTPQQDPRHASRMARVDGCPECVVNVEAPIHAHEVEGGHVAFYECSDCGHAWSTAWGEC